jgi:hypothetical protein
MGMNEFFEEERHRWEIQMKEIWKDVVGYEDFYMVSSNGKMISKERIIKRKNGADFLQKESFMNGSEYHGYIKITVRKNNIKKDKFIHCLIAESFLGTKPIGMEVCHFDGNRKNNNINNLRYGTRSDNVKDAIKHGTHYTPFSKKGSERSYAKINEQIAKYIKESKDSGSVLAQKFNVSRALISNVRNKKSWVHVD